MIVQDITKDITKQKAYMLLSVVTLVAILPMPYAYYNLLRVTVFAVLGFSLHCKTRTKEFDLWFYVKTVVFVLFNPIIPIHFDRFIWAIIDLAVSCIFAYKAWILRTKATKAP